MEQLLAIVVFGILGAITVFGYISSQRSARERSRGDFQSGHVMAGTSGSQSDQQRP